MSYGLHGRPSFVYFPCILMCIVCVYVCMYVCMYVCIGDQEFYCNYAAFMLCHFFGGLNIPWACVGRPLVT